MTRTRGVIAILLVLILAFAASQARLVEVEGRRALAWAWQDGAVAFTNSVTGRPVRIEFSLRRNFSDFRMVTDPDTEGYYTGGEYRINDRLRHEVTRELNYCSVVGMQLRIGAHAWNINNHCLTARLLWPPG